MNPRIQPTLLIAVGVLVLLALSLVRWRRKPTHSALAQVLGAVSALLVVPAHIAEARQLWPSMGWGQPHSVGHYMDFASALFSVIFLSAAAVPALRSLVQTHYANSP